MVVFCSQGGSRRCPVSRPKGCTGVLGTQVVHSTWVRHTGKIWRLFRLQNQREELGAHRWPWILGG